VDRTDDSRHENFAGTLRIAPDASTTVTLGGNLFREDRTFGTTLSVAARTIGSATLGLEHEIGSLEPGKKADLVLFNADTPQWQPLYCEPYNLVYSASGDSADTVIVDGKIVMENREVKTIDEREVITRIKALSRGVEARSGVKPPTRWPIV